MSRTLGPGGGGPARSRYGWVVGLAGFVLLVVVTLNSITTEGVNSGGPKPGKRMPPFAVPLADSDVDKDANLATEPGQGQLGDRPACEVRGPDVLNVCEQWELGPVVLAVFPTAAPRCRAVLRQLARMKGRFPRVRFAAVGSKGDRDDLRGTWGFPVGWDRDARVLALYGAVDCPQLTFAHRGGEVAGSAPRGLSDAELERRVRELR
ncbi:MAG TPA: hypothetical protein VGW75_11385 [Solirubrobacteraceae bacterium]|nr:hypothetical protein [Solirubrobacteraceae bacterium]